MTAEFRRQRISSNLNARPTINTLATIAIATHRSWQIRRTSTPFRWEKLCNMSSMHLWLVWLLLPIIIQAKQRSRYWRQVPQRPLYPTQLSFNEAWCLETYNIDQNDPNKNHGILPQRETMRHASITYAMISERIPISTLPSVPTKTPATQCGIRSKVGRRSRCCVPSATTVSKNIRFAVPVTKKRPISYF